MKIKNTTLVFTILVFLFTGFNLTLAQNKSNKDKVTIKKHQMMKDSTATHSTKMMDNINQMIKKCKTMMDNPEMQLKMKKMMKKMMDKTKGEMMGKTGSKMMDKTGGKMMPDSTKKMNKSLHESHHQKDKK